MHLISISGVAGSGKTTISAYLKTYFQNACYSTSEFSFAGPLKDACVLWFGWDRSRLDSDFGYKEGDKLDDGSPDPYCKALGMTRRQIMQKLGTECMRQGMHSDFWVILADLGVYFGKIPPSNIYFLSDARFRNELAWAKSMNAYRILVTRTEIARGETEPTVGNTLTAHTSHASETEFLDYDDYDEKIVNLIDHNQVQKSNLNGLTKHLDDVTIPAIRQRHNLVGKGKNDWNLWR